MAQARRWVRGALFGLIGASLVFAAPVLVRAAEEKKTEVLGWEVSGAVEAGGRISFGERSSSKFEEYRDMDNGFLGLIDLKGEKKEGLPYFFHLRAVNPSRGDQAYEGAFGRYRLFKLDLGWDRTPHVLANDARTIFQLNQSGSEAVFSLPPTLRPSIAADTGVAGACGTLIRWNCPVEYSAGSPAIGVPQRNFIRDTISGLLRPVDLRFNTDVARADFKLTPTEDWRFDVGYSNLRRQGFRPAGTVIGSPGGPVTELAIPIENFTHEVKVGGEYTRPTWGVQLNYTGSLFRNEYTGYTWDNPGAFGATDSATSARVSRAQFAAPPDNVAHTFTGTGTLALPWRTRIAGTFAYSLLRQDETFLLNTLNRANPQTNLDDSGADSPDAKHDVILANIMATSRPINNVTATARYRYFEYQNRNPVRTFSRSDPEGFAVQTHETLQEGHRKQNASFDLGWRPIRPIALKAGYEYEHWNRGDREVSSTDEHIGKFAADLTPSDWFLGRVTYRYGSRTVGNYIPPGRTAATADSLIGELPQLRKFDEADRRLNKLDLLAQFSPWETLTPSVNFGYALEDYHRSAYGLTKSEYWSAGAGLGWSPVSWLNTSLDYTYEQYHYNQLSRYRPVVSSIPAGSPCVATLRAPPPAAPSFNLDCTQNDWDSRNRDHFHTVGLMFDFDLVPKKFSLSLGYALSYGETIIKSSNQGTPTVATTGSAGGVVSAAATDRDKVENLLHTVKIVLKYNLTKSLSARLGYAFERYTEKDFARDPLTPFVGDLDTANAGVQSVFLGATQPNYEAHIASFMLRYEF